MELTCPKKNPIGDNESLAESLEQEGSKETQSHPETPILASPIRYK
jgi:hypothetical protein